MSCAFINKMKCLGATDIDLEMMANKEDTSAVVKSAILNRQGDKAYAEMNIRGTTKIVEIYLVNNEKVSNDTSRTLLWYSRTCEEFCILSIKYFGKQFKWYTILADKDMNIGVIEGASGFCRCLRIANGGSLLSFDIGENGRYVEYCFIDGKVYNRGFTRNKNNKCIDYIDKMGDKKKFVVSSKEVEQPDNIKILETE